MRCLNYLLLCLLSLSLLPPSHAQTDPVQALIDQMTPEQRIGQLLLVSARITDLNPDSDLFRLIQQYHIGGVILLPETNPGSTPAQMQALTNGLQELSYYAATNQELPYVPLFMATAQHGNGLTSGATALPDYMALGATWEPAYAELAGAIAGQELAAMGINMLLGPALDVATPTSPLPGLQTFGGQPGWVGRMGVAYTTGLHTGSENRLLVIARQFPGRGAIDRPLEQEIPVIPRSIADLWQQDLVPFFATTGGVPPDDPGQVDGVQCANVRYRNAGTETRPVCLDETAFRLLATDTRYGEWWQQGIVLSDNLGTQAIRRWYNSTPFPHRQVARDALLAGNTLLYLDNFGTHPGESSLTNIIDTLQFFTESYLSDPLFKARVDTALYTNLSHKISLYGINPGIETVLAKPESLTAVGQQGQPLYEVARRAVTLIAPVLDQLPPTPQSGQRLVIVTDTQTQADLPLIPVNALADTIRRLYGNAASGQINDELISSFALNNLGSEEAQAALGEADWIIFVMVDQAAAIQRFLATAPRNSRIIALAMGAPTHLTATDISKLSAYYGIYGYSQPFIDAAARAVFQEVPFSGRLPISLPTINYDVQTATTPDPAQNLILTITVENRPEAALTSLKMGDTLRIQTGIILDRNGKPVPDGTPVTFTLNFVMEGLQTEAESVTVDGSAGVSLSLRRAGTMQISASSGPATTQTAQELTVQVDEQAQTATAAFSQTPTATRTPTLAPTRTPNQTQIARATEIASAFQAPPVTVTPEPEVERGLVTISDFLLSLMGLLLLVIPAFTAGWASSRSLDGSIRIVLGTVVAGLTGYVYYGIAAPGSHIIQEAMGDLAAMVVAFVSGIIGLVFTWWTVREISQRR